MTKELEDIKFLLEDRVRLYNGLDFIDSDPIQVPHQFTDKEDIEIAAFLTATLAWGQRKSIITNANRLMELMDHAPYEFVRESVESDRKALSGFVHRTFNGMDCEFFMLSLQNIYLHHGGLEKVFSSAYEKYGNVYGALIHFRDVFLSLPHDYHVRKHLSDVSANSSAKRLNMFLRWMVRSDENQVDFGLWKKMPASALMLPLDVHTGDVARALGILTRKQNDWKAVCEITDVLRLFDPIDPIKYDFALFGIGAYKEKFLHLK